MKIRDELIEHNMLLAEYSINHSNIKYLKTPYTEKELLVYEALIKGIDYYIKACLIEYDLSIFVLKNADWVAYKKYDGNK